MKNRPGFPERLGLDEFDLVPAISMHGDGAGASIIWLDRVFKGGVLWGYRSVA